MNYDEQLIGELLKLSHLTEDKEHLSKTIHEAAVRLEEMTDRFRKYALQRITHEQMGEDSWAWQGDGEDHIESMSEGMVVKITAGDLRRLIDRGSVAQGAPKLSRTSCDDYDRAMNGV